MTDDVKPSGGEKPAPNPTPNSGGTTPPPKPKDD